uniref:Uncharacterized protein n=1 Tax=Candidatus Kentrum sp. UNK TaxID=2126344 RepID=A0A451AUF2_9GAMM|nr:MAG: hypothetical protein BECKUNK1418G_GA0071005_14372 [Candidatus Kentron sp. UNK]
MENWVFKPTTVRRKAESRSSPPLLANIALNSLDWLLNRHGLRSNVTPMISLFCAPITPKLKKH